MSTLVLFSAAMERDPAIAPGIPDDWFVETVGVGPVEAAVGTLRAIVKHLPSEIIFAGTCGAYPGSNIAVGEIVTVREVRLTSGDVLAGAARIPKIQPEGCLPLRWTRGRIRDVEALCTIGITEDEELARRLGAHGEVENLELFSICRAAAPMPVRSILGVTNVVGANGGEEWKKNYREVMTEVGRRIFGEEE